MFLLQISILHILDKGFFVKGRVIDGSPGSGKSFLLNYTAIYSMSKGLKVVITALMEQHAVHWEGIHIHTLFYIPVSKHVNLHIVSELALQSLIRNPVKLTILKMVDVILLDAI